ncbi:type VII secretion target [Nocardia brasiliensis]|uniref:type VII secretion target n=1 Tax=Nocardia brasiliensis TaxID=37326 RepID=UPI002454BD3A|nr:type VII secretion target [Nocardia brasiliensis]
MRKLHVEPGDLDRLAYAHDDAAQQLAVYGRPNEPLMETVLATHGDVAAPFVAAMAEYYQNRQSATTAAAADHTQTAQDLRVSRADYVATDQDNASAATRAVGNL